MLLLNIIGTQQLGFLDSYQIDHQMFVLYIKYLICSPFPAETSRGTSCGALSAVGEGRSRALPPPLSTALVNGDVLEQTVSRGRMRGGDVPSGRAAAPSLGDAPRAPALAT